MTEKGQRSVPKVGMATYLHNAPIYERWKENGAKAGCREVVAPYGVLNDMLAEDRLDLGFICSFEYGLHYEKYRILSGLSITAEGPGGAIYLFSHVPVEQLDKAPVLVASQSQTSVQLIKIILEEFYSVYPKYTTELGDESSSDQFMAILAEGDEALRIVESSAYLYQFDLCDIWRRNTGSPFVIAVCAVREEFCTMRSAELDVIHTALLKCRDEGTENVERVCDIAAGIVPISKSKCREYLGSFGYDLDNQKRKGLKKFYEILIDRGTIAREALSLKIYSNLSL